MCETSPDPGCAGELSASVMYTFMVSSYFQYKNWLRDIHHKQHIEKGYSKKS